MHTTAPKIEIKTFSKVQRDLRDMTHQCAVATLGFTTKTGEAQRLRSALDLAEQFMQADNDKINSLQVCLISGLGFLFCIPSLLYTE